MNPFFRKVTGHKRKRSFDDSSNACNPSKKIRNNQPIQHAQNHQTNAPVTINKPDQMYNSNIKQQSFNCSDNKFKFLKHNNNNNKIFKQINNTNILNESFNNKPFINLFENINTTKKYKIAASLSTGAKIEITDSIAY